MATPAYMSITGTKQGLITAGAFTEDSVGNTYQEGHEDQVMVQGFNHEVIIPRDPQSGQPTGQRVHKPVVITKVFDKASPLLLAGRLAGLRVTRDDHFVVEALDHHLVLVAFLIGVADRVLGEGAGGDQALLGAGDGHIGGGCHGYVPCR